MKKSVLVLTFAAASCLTGALATARIYRLLAEGGEVFMKMEKTPFANRFAMLRDRFGTSWMLLHQAQ